MGTLARSIALGTLGLLAACTDSEGSSEPYAVVSSDEWTMQSAIDPPQDDALTSVERPPLDWYSEHVRTLPVSGGTEGQMVRLSGHSTSIRESRAALEEVGWEFEAVPLDEWEAVGGTNPAESASPAVVLLDHGSMTFMLLSYELTVDEVTAFADAVEAVDEATWKESGGVIQ